jgi:DNA repair exonuclease SbcCD ATPase subunit
MSNEKYVNVYVETMTSTLTDAVLRNISLQANAKISEDIIKEQSDRIGQLENLVNQTTEGQGAELENLNGIIGENSKTIEELTLRVNDTDKIKSENDSLKKVLNGHLETIGQLNKKVQEYEALKSEYESVKHQVNHVDTFRNELVKEREQHEATRIELSNKINDLQNQHGNIINNLQHEHSDIISKLNDQIEYLQLTPAKRKKIDEIKSTLVDIDDSSKSTKKIEDGGSF